MLCIKDTGYRPHLTNLNLFHSHLVHKFVVGVAETEKLIPPCKKTLRCYDHSIVLTNCSCFMALTKPFNYLIGKPGRKEVKISKI